MSRLDDERSTAADRAAHRLLLAYRGARVAWACRSFTRPLRCHRRIIDVAAVAEFNRPVVIQCNGRRLARGRGRGSGLLGSRLGGSRKVEGLQRLSRGIVDRLGSWVLFRRGARELIGRQFSERFLLSFLGQLIGVGRHRQAGDRPLGKWAQRGAARRRNALVGTKSRPIRHGIADRRAL